NHSSTIYEDAGDEYGYEDGQFAIKTFKTTGAEGSLTVQQTIQGDYDPAYNNYVVTFHGLPFEPKECIVDGSSVQFEIVNESKNMIKVRVNKAFQEMTVSN